MPRATGFALELATQADAAAIAELRTQAAERLRALHGDGHWARGPSERGVLYEMRVSRVFVAREEGRVVGTLALATRKPWAIDPSYFETCRRPLYLLAMAVAPARQRQGVGRRCVTDAHRLAREWPADALRLDAYDAAAGAGDFYRACGFREVGRVAYRGVPLLYFESVL